MLIYNKLKKILILSILVLSVPIFAFGASYNDVDTSHWAYGAISRLSDKGIMVGDSNGNFNPTQAIDKFYVAKVMAKIAGFKYINLSEQEQIYIQKAYETNKTVLEQYTKKFTRWDDTGNKEIAYLLEKKILTAVDLNQFVVRTSDGVERLRALSYEELAVFAVKLMNKDNEAVSKTYTTKFNDDSKIAEDKKPYVYYLKEKGILRGDEKNMFNPKTAVTKASMAVVFDKVVSELEKTNTQSQQQNQQNQQNTNNQNSVDTNTNKSLVSISGEIYNVYTAIKTIQIKDTNSFISSYKINVSAHIYLDGSIRMLEDLRSGMSVTGIVSNGEITELKAVSSSSGTNINNGTNTNGGTNINNGTNTNGGTNINNGTNTNGGININNGTNTNGGTNINNGINTNGGTNINNGTNTNGGTNINNGTNNNISSQNLTEIEGMVLSASVDGTVKKLTVKINSISASGIVSTNENTYFVTDDCKITKDAIGVNFSNIAVGDILYMSVSGSNAKQIEIAQKIKTISGGLLTGKRYDSNVNQTILTVRDVQGKDHNFIVTKNSYITRKGIGKCMWDSLRIGDIVSVRTEYGKITDLAAAGVISDVFGYVNSIVLSQNENSIYLTNGNNEFVPEKYILGNDNINFNDITIGSYVKLYLDSNEVVDIELMERD